MHVLYLLYGLKVKTPLNFICELFYFFMALGCLSDDLKNGGGCVGGLSASMKYVIYADVEIDGIVEKPDIIGAIFGQTEGLLGEDLDLRELQKTGRIGRIQVRVSTKDNKTVGTLMVPSNLDRVETALIAAAIESVDKIGPYSAKVKVTKIEDLRAKKRKWIIERAKELLRKWEEEEAPESRKLAEEVLKAIRAAEVISFGPEKLPAGPEVASASTIIVVEGRADVINLLKHGYKNVIGLEGATIPKTIVDLSKKKTVIAFVDGDRGGDLILKNLINVAEIDFVARAPSGREVEELTGKEIAKCLRNKVPVEEYLEVIRKEKPTKVLTIREEKELGGLGVEIPGEVVDRALNLAGTLEGYFYDREWREIAKFAVSELAELIPKYEEIYAIVFDGIVTQRVLDEASRRNVRVIIANRIGKVAKLPEDIKIVTFNELRKTSGKEEG